MDYFITLEIELMNEDAASIMATISRYVIAKNMENDEKHPLNILEKMLFDIYCPKKYICVFLKEVSSAFLPRNP